MPSERAAAPASLSTRPSRASGPAVRARATPLPTEARLLSIAGDHLRRLGPRHVTVVAVAAEAAMTHANVYRYFPSKDALLDAVAGRWLRAVETELAGIADAPDPPDDKIERLLTAWPRPSAISSSASRTCSPFTAMRRWRRDRSRGGTACGCARSSSMSSKKAWVQAPSRSATGNGPSPPSSMRAFGSPIRWRSSTMPSFRLICWMRDSVP